MNIFVSSWYFPPITSSEGIVTYKLLRNSSNYYDVVNSTSKQWSYKKNLLFKDEKNITSYPIETDSIDKWVNFCLMKFEELNKIKHYKCVMTRSTPPESILVGQQIKEKYPNIKWIASLADPIANNPYELKAYVDDNPTLSENEKNELKSVLKSSDETLMEKWRNHPNQPVRLLCKLKKMENVVIKYSDLIISPSNRQLQYLLGKKNWMNKCFALPHSFDKSFYPSNISKKSDKIVMSFIGYSDNLRSLEPFVRAVYMLKCNHSPNLDKLEMNFIGNNPRILQDMILNYYLDDIIHFKKNVDYYESLKIMSESDWLLHVDANFPQLQPGGSIFFAGKIADYMGAGRPIFALTGTGSPADRIVKKSGGISLPQNNIEAIADELENIISGTYKVKLNETFIAQYSADVVAANFDKRVAQLFNKSSDIVINNWPKVQKSNCDKLVTICVPSYDVERYLTRCLKTLLSHDLAHYLDIIVVNDGSKDNTAIIGAEFENHYPGIVRLISKENGGHGSTINTAIKEGTGQYFMVVDADDWIDSEQFEKLLSKIKNGEIDTDIISSNYHEVDMGTGVCSPWVQQTPVKYFKKMRFEELDTENVYFTLASSVIKLSILKNMNMPLQEHTFYVDVEYILFPIPYINTVMFVDYYIYKYCRGNDEQSVYIPTMVKRYDHHERVMKRVLQYEKDMDMSKYQKNYYDAIIRRLLYTHYALMLVYDTDMERGVTRCKEFDSFLKKLDTKQSTWIENNMPILKKARQCNFDCQKLKILINKNTQNKKNSLKFKVKPILKKLVYNNTTVKIGKSHFFTEGAGKKLKLRLRKFCGFC